MLGKEINIRGEIASHDFMIILDVLNDFLIKGSGLDQITVAINDWCSRSDRYTTGV